MCGSVWRAGELCYNLGMTKIESKASEAGRKTRLTPRTLLEVKRLSEPQMHPDGERIAFVVNEADFEESLNVSHIWLTEWPIDDEEDAEDAPGHGSKAESESPPDSPEDLARQLTFSRDGEDYPKWSPDGRFLAFLSARPDPTKSEDDEDEEPAVQIWVLPENGGEAYCVTDTKEGVIDYAWTADSASVVYLAPEPRPRPLESVRKDERDRRKVDPVVEHEDRLRRQFWQIEVDNGKPKLLHTADYGVQEFALAPDDSRLVYVTNRTGDSNDYHVGDLVLVTLPDGTSRDLPPRPGDKTHLRWSPDGKRLAFLAWLDPALSYSRQSLYALDLVNADTIPDYRLMTDPAFDYDITCFEWCSEDGALYALAAVGTGSEIVRVEDDSTERLSADNATVMEDLSVDPDGGALVFVAESATAFPEIFGRDVEGTLRPLTRLNAEISERHILPRQEVVSWNSADGTCIEGVLTYPNDYVAGTRIPLITDIHGGPKGRALNRLRSYSFPPVWAAEGYAVLRPNFRGSEGYGNAFAIANRRDLGGGDFADIMAGVDWCIAQGIADPERLGVMGGSYGGYMTNWAIGHTDRFKAAISMFGIFHLQTDYSNSELSRWDNDYLGAYYWEDPEIFRRLSPGSYLTQIKTPTLILHGDEDTNTVLSNSRELYQALRHLGVVTQFVHYPRESHGLNEPNHRLDEIRRCLAWMDRFLKHDGKIHDSYRLHDAVPNPAGDLELLVIQAELTTFTGQPKPEESTPKSEQTALLEIVFTLHSPQPKGKEYALTLTPESLRLESTQSEFGTLHPVGLPLDLPGGKVLAETQEWRLVHHTDADSGQFALACAVVFRVPNLAGHALFRVADFPPVALQWVVDADETKHSSSES
jgi:dipeptidyl aminopeptidase/acylaminoacyl peptidase